MREILNLSLGFAADNFDETVNFNGNDYRIKRLGVDFNVDLLKSLVLEYKNNVDAISISGYPDPLWWKGEKIVHSDLSDIQKLLDNELMLSCGEQLRTTVMSLAIKDFIRHFPEKIKNKKIGFFSGIIQYPVLELFEEAGARLIMADPYFIYGLPVSLKGVKQLEQFYHYKLSILKNVKMKKMSKRDFGQASLKKNIFMKDFFSAEVLVLNCTQVEYINLPDLTDKIVIVDYLSDRALKNLKENNVAEIWAASEKKLEISQAGLTILESILLAQKELQLPLTDDEIMQGVSDFNIKPVYVKCTSIEKSVKFAFIVHPLHKMDLVKHPILGAISKYPRIINTIEKAASFVPGFKYGEIKGIKSEFSGIEIKGDIWAVSDTPKMLLKSNVETVYKKLIDICYKAAEMQSQIIGLGAYTKIVGDAGVSVNDKSPIPVTTGNSLSAASTLWAANYGLNKMNLIQAVDGVYQGAAMVVGATGSIGKVSAKILALSWSELIVVAPRPYKLIELVNEIKSINPKISIKYTTNANKYIDRADLIITSTSAQGEKVLDIQLVKPGAVICDVSRPFDISKKDAISRPDVLVIASGEVILPGKVELSCDIGLKGSTVYACLAETAILALENKIESFSLSRDISYDKVMEIDQLARKHGVKLAAIMGHEHEITDEEIALCRQHALNRQASCASVNSHESK